MPIPKAGFDIAYWEIIQNVITERNIELDVEKPVSLILGLFSHNSPTSERELNKLNRGTGLLSSRNDIGKNMKDTWETNADVQLKYNQIRQIFSSLEDEVSLNLKFDSPNDFSRSQLRKKIQLSESSLLPDKQGLTKLLVTIRILQLLIDFVKDYINNFNEMLRGKNYTSLMDLISDILEQPWGERFLSRLENDNVVAKTLGF